MSAAFLFDVDGTSIDSVDLHAKAWQETLAHFGFDIAYEQVRGQIGKGGDQLLPVFVPKNQLERLSDRVEKYRGETAGSDVENSKPCPDVFEAAIARVSVEPARALVIGDTPYHAIGGPARLL